MLVGMVSAVCVPWEGLIQMSAKLSQRERVAEEWTDGFPCFAAVANVSLQ